MILIFLHLNIHAYFPTPNTIITYFKSRANSVLLTSPSLFRLFLTLPRNSSELSWLKRVRVLAQSEIAY